MTSTIAGVDGCKAGWVAVVRNGAGEPEAFVIVSMAELVDRLPADAIVAVDMPIGLPDFIGSVGRGPERLVRPLLGQRQSSVFSIPSRSAVYAETEPFGSLDDWYAAHRRASEVARATSDPPRKISIQAFGIFSKIREIDALLIARPDLRSRLFESHPEVAFWRLNGEQPLNTPKKVKGRINLDGMAERRAIMARHGLSEGFLAQPPPRGGGADDFLDACAMMLIADRKARGIARSFPSEPVVDSANIPIAIWA